MEKFHLLTLQSRNALTDSFLTFAISSMGISLSLAPCVSLSFSPMSDSPSAVLELQKVKTQLQTEKTKCSVLEDKVEELQPFCILNNLPVNGYSIYKTFLP